jgi:hypothetical protein
VRYEKQQLLGTQFHGVPLNGSIVELHEIALETVHRPTHKPADPVQHRKNKIENDLLPHLQPFRPTMLSLAHCAIA